MAENLSEPKGLYNPEEPGHGACGVIQVTSLNAEPDHRVVQMVYEGLANTKHRAGQAADGFTTDGVGATLTVDHDFFREQYNKIKGHRLNENARLGVGHVFLPQDENLRAQCKDIIAELLENPLFSGLKDAKWRQVPLNMDVFGHTEEERQQKIAYNTLPHIEQLLIPKPEGMDDKAYERTLYILRKAIEKKAAEKNLSGSGKNTFHFSNLSADTVTYKATTPTDKLASVTLKDGRKLDGLYADFDSEDPRIDRIYEAEAGLAHDRFATNKPPDPTLIQPFSTIAHNGEINTNMGNIKWWESYARKLAAEKVAAGELKQEEMGFLFPLTSENISDSANFNAVYEFLIHIGGHSHEYIYSILMPEALRTQADIPENQRMMYEVMEAELPPSQGPAFIATISRDGKGKRKAVGRLDAGGYRPARDMIVKDAETGRQYRVLASEDKVIHLPEENIIQRGRLGPGEGTATDLDTGEIITDATFKNTAALERNFAKLHAQIKPLKTGDFTGQSVYSPGEFFERQSYAGWTLEDEMLVLYPMGTDGKEPISSMGDVAAPAFLSRFYQPLHNFVKQKFAQVTNPPTDSIREKDVTRLTTYIGYPDEDNPDNIVIKLESPILSNADFASMRTRVGEDRIETIDCIFPIGVDADAMSNHLEEIKDMALAAAKAGKHIILTDDKASRAFAALDMMKVVADINDHLLKNGCREKISINVRSAQAISTHSIATLIGAGATTVNPYLAEEALRAHQKQGDFKQKKLQEPDLKSRLGELTGKSLGKRLWLITEPEFENVPIEKVLGNYYKASNDGLLKIMAKMGVQHVGSYRGALLFEALGLAMNFIGDLKSPIGGFDLKNRQQQIVEHYKNARFYISKNTILQERGQYHARDGGETQAISATATALLQAACLSGKDEDYQVYLDQVAKDRDGHPTNITDLLEIDSDAEAISEDDVQSLQEIISESGIGQMSIGALAPEAHAASAEGANKVKAGHGSGEGGQVNFAPNPDGTNPNSTRRQRASGLFGADTEYFTGDYVEEIEIKIAQGAKPGEGGQLDAAKVSGMIAYLRNVAPGTTLISPPPHHDIYSIEDLRQLIDDLKQLTPNLRILALKHLAENTHADVNLSPMLVKAIADAAKGINPTVRISVKLVASTGIGNIACGVAKAGADIIHISGNNGGTGAAALSSINHAGMPKEIGVAEAHQALTANGLREGVILRTDGRVETSEDQFIMHCLGADQVVFGTDSMRAGGCNFLKDCETNNCATGWASQKKKLRALLRANPKAKPEVIANFLTLRAQAVRKLLAATGKKNIKEIIGHTELLKQIPKEKLEEILGRDAGIELSRLLHRPKDPPQHCTLKPGERKEPEATLDHKILEDESSLIEDLKNNKGSKVLKYKTNNQHRTIGARLSYFMIKKFGNDPISKDKLFAADWEARRTIDELGWNPKDMGRYIMHKMQNVFGPLPARARKPKRFTNLKDDSLVLDLEGSAGQKAGTGAVNGLTIIANNFNDGVGSSLSGGIIVGAPHKKSRYTHETHKHAMAGNAVLYGAVAGKAFFAGTLGLRAGVRNSGAEFVCEGAGDNAAEYMTGGTGVFLGDVGYNFGAGMSGTARCFVYDPKNKLTNRFNESVKTEKIEIGSTAEKKLKGLVQEHFNRTASSRAAEIAYSRNAMGRMVFDETKWRENLSSFHYVAPKDGQKPGRVMNFVGKFYKEPDPFEDLRMAA